MVSNISFFVCNFCGKAESFCTRFNSRLVRYMYGINHVYVGVKNGLSLSCSMQRSLYTSSISKLNFLESIKLKRVVMCLCKCGHVPGKDCVFLWGHVPKERECAILGGARATSSSQFLSTLKIFRSYSKLRHVEPLAALQKNFSISITCGCHFFDTI